MVDEIVVNSKMGLVNQNNEQKDTKTLQATTESGNICLGLSQRATPFHHSTYLHC